MPANFNIRCKWRGGQKVVTDLANDSTFADLRSSLAGTTGILAVKQRILIGFPPKLWQVDDSATTLEELGLKNGETLIVEEDATIKTPEDAELVDGDAGDDDEVQIVGGTLSQSQIDVQRRIADEIVAQENSTTPGILMRQVVPSDNSCLFTSVDFVINNAAEVNPNAAPSMRGVISSWVKSHPDDYSQAILGKSINDYCSWIENPQRWGGAIELSILSSHFRMEIDAIDTLTGRIDQYGQDKQYAQRVMLIYDGIHYDPLYLEPFDGSPLKTVFSLDDSSVFDQATQLAAEAKASRQFTDTTAFMLKCLDCQILLKGQTEATEHAKSSGHTNFGEQ